MQTESSSPVRVDLKHFLSSGIFGPISLGMTIDRLLDLLGPPTSTFPARPGGVAGIISYGDVDLHFFGDNRTLSLIDLSEFEVPRGSSTIEIDPWVLVGGMGEGELRAALAQEGIDHRVMDEPDTGVRKVVTQAGVEIVLEFDQEDESQPASLYGLSCDEYSGGELKRKFFA